jgi:hypothetical protein
MTINETNLITANYTDYVTSESLVNSTCYFNSTEGNVTMGYNATSELYYVNVVPDDYGTITFTVNCSNLEYTPQYHSQNYTANAFGIMPYNFTVYLWEDKNATTPYIDEFAFIVMATEEYNCSSISGYDYCVFNARYRNGQANLTLYFESNYSMFFYSGELTFETEISPPTFHSFNDLMFFGVFLIEQGQDRMDLWVNAWELDFWAGVKGFLMTWGILIGAFVFAILVAVVSFLLFGKKSLSILLFLLILYGIFVLWNAGVFGLPAFPSLEGFSSIF